MKTRLATLVLAIACAVLIATPAIAGDRSIRIGSTGMLTDISKASTPTINPGGPGDAPKHQITYIASRPDSKDDIVLVLDINGRLSYSHTAGTPGLGKGLPVNIHLDDVVDMETVNLAFGLFTAVGFDGFPSSFPPGGTSKDQFDVWVTLETPTIEKTVFASSSSLVSEEFHVLQNVLDAVTRSVEDRVVLEFDIFDGEGSMLGGIRVQADGDATILKAPILGAGGVGFEPVERHVQSDRMDDIFQAIDDADFFQIPTCDNEAVETIFGDEILFELSVFQNGRTHTVRFGTGTEIADDLAPLVEWGLNQID